jgi:hypothetical protein
VNAVTPANNQLGGYSMRTAIYVSRSVRAIVFVLVAVSAAANAQTSPGGDPAEEFYRLTKATPASFSNGEMGTAAQMAESLLKEAENWKDNWNYGNAIQAGNIVLGRIALKKGETAKAKQFLFAAGRTPGSPQLNSFGPDMSLAKELLAKGEKEAVLEYFELCSKFWGKHHQKQLDEWSAAVKQGDVPEFGANLKYLGF